jgi:hypothetical protein
MRRAARAAADWSVIRAIADALLGYCRADLEQ